MFRPSACAGESIVYECHKSVTEIVQKNYISGSIWHKSFIQTLKYSIFEGGRFYQSF